MRIRQIDFPPAVLTAQRDAQLVIFAGAGVSIDPPSSYPDFDALGAQVGGNAHPRMPGEAIDRYLGRLVNEGVTVHEQVRTILSSPLSMPNAMHRALVGLFKIAPQLKIVTTNFDRHFTSAAADRFAEAVPELFYAPALPVGSEFTGIVYLHGTVERPANRLVLTDSDFGRAYITDGWATRFLERLFSRFVVLFVGYSHQDILLSYLARGLTAGSPSPGRFALTLPGDDARWNNLGITPVHYPVAGSPDRHSALRVALLAWAEQSEAGALAVEERIRTILTSGIALTPEDDDFLRSALAEPATLRFFTRHARDIKWLKWVENQKEFQRLFSVRAGYTEQDAELATWLAEHYALPNIEETLDIMRRQQSRLSPLLAGTIATALFRNKTHGETLSKWVTVLVENDLPRGNRDVLEYVLSHCAYPEDAVSALSLFEYLTRPRIKLTESMRWPDDGGKPSAATGVEVDCVGSDYWLQHSWNALFLPNLGKLAKRIQPIITAHLVAARRLMMSFGKVMENWDPLSSSRGMIESRVQDHLYNGFSSVIDAGVALIKWACQNDDEWARAVTCEWFGSESPLLRRLAVYAVSESTMQTADDKLRWVANNDLLYKFGFKHEVFMLRRAAYGHASEVARQELLREAKLQHKPFTSRPEATDYELFNLINWLADSDPGCNLAAVELAALKEKNPGFGRREHPDMDSWIGPVSYGGWESSIPTAELESLSVQELIERLQAAPSTGYPGGGSQQALIQEIGQQAQSSHGWGLTIARQAQHHSIWSEYLWQSLLSAWGATDLTADEWSGVLDILTESKALYENAAELIASLLERGARSTTAPIPSNLVDKAKLLADGIWNRCENVPVGSVSDQIDWLGRAINHPAGQLVEFYLQSMAILQRAGSLTDERRSTYQQSFTRAVESSSPGAQLARIVVASQAHYLFAIDEQWTRDRVFPLLDPRQDEQRATQCWNGYLYWGRWTDAMLVDLMPSYEAMFARIAREKDEIRRLFCGHLAAIAVYASIHPLEQGWLPRFIATVQPNTRAVWAGEVGTFIGQLDDSATVHLWRRWLKAYWQERLVGRPMPLAPTETAQMFEWVLHLSPVIPEVVELLCASPYPELGHAMAYYEVSQSPLLKQYPDTFAKLLIYLTGGERGRAIYDLPQLHSAVEQLVEVIPRNQQLRTLCDELARLGVPGVAALAAKLDPPYTPAVP